MNDLEFEATSLLYGIKVAFNRLGELQKLATDRGYTFEPTVANKLLPVQLVGSAVVFKAFPQTSCMAECTAQHKSPEDCARHCAQVIQVPDPRPPKP